MSNNREIDLISMWFSSDIRFRFETRDWVEMTFFLVFIFIFEGLFNFIDTFILDLYKHEFK